MAELQHGEIREYDISPEDFGLPVYADLNDLKVDDAAQSMALMNAAACLYAANVCRNLTEGVALAKEALQSGRAKAKQLQWLAMNPA